MVSEKAIIKGKGRAQRYLSKGYYGRALGEFQKLVHTDPTNLRASLKVGDLLQKMGRSAEAVAFSPLFGGLQPHQRAQLAVRFKLRRIGEDRLIYEQGAPHSRKRLETTGQVVSPSWNKKATAAMV